MKIHYEAENSLTAFDVSQILMHAAKSFERFTRSKFRRNDLTLIVGKVERGSLTIELIVAGIEHTAEEIYANKEIIFGFSSFLSSCIAISQALRPGKNKALETRLIEALIDPILKGDAHSVTIGAAGRDSSVNLDRVAADRVRQLQSESSQKSITQKEASAPYSADEQTQALVSRPRQLTLQGRWGTVFDVKGSLYVRLEGEEGVLNPLHLTQNVSVLDGEAYKFDGFWEGRSYKITAAQSIA